MLVRRGMIFAALATLHAQSAQAGVYTDDLTKCLVAKASEADRTVLVQWVFSMMSVSPAVASMASLTPAQREEYSRKGSDLVARLVGSDCRSETVTALRYEGVESMRVSFDFLGGIAMQGLMGHPNVQTEMGAFVARGKETYEGLTKEAGLAPATPAAETGKK